MSNRAVRWRGFYFITDSALTVNGVIEDSRLALEAGIAMLQYREKDRSDINRVLNEATAIRDMCRKSGVPFIMNDDIELALETGADGVHVGQGDAPAAETRRTLGTKAIVGVSVATVKDVDGALEAGADYVAVSPVFSTGTKSDAGPGLGIDRLREIKRHSGVPVAAIGGINEENIASVVESGADLICAISASLRNGAVVENIQRLMQEMKKINLNTEKKEEEEREK